MKRFLLFVLAVIMLAMPLVGCSSPQNAASGDQSGTLQTGANSNEQSGSAGVGIVGNGQGNSSGDDSAVTGTIKNTGGIFFRPGTAGTGDVTPYYYNGQYYLFFLHSTNFRWCFVTTKDFVTYSDVTVLRDFGGTGTVLNVDGIWHIFASKTENGEEVIHHYEGEDITSLRDTFNNVRSDGNLYASFAWRDPYVYFDDSIGKYRMLVTTNANDSDTVLRDGAVANLVSDDLYNWVNNGTFFDSGYYSGACECPDTFKMGDWYYLVYSDCSYGKRTYYVKSQNPDGPWQVPENDTFDSLLFYAAKTVSNGTDRYVIGWAGDRSQYTMALNDDGTLIDPDFATVKYAGNMVVHKLVQLSNGDLSVVPVNAVVSSFNTSVSNELKPATGSWQTGRDYAKTTAENGFASVLMQKLPEQFVLTFKLKTNAKQVGIALQVDDSFSGKGYYYTFDRQYSRLKQTSGILSGVAGYYFPYETELERPLHMEPDKIYDVTVVADGEIAVIYVNGECALTTRMTQSGLSLGLFCYAGSAEFTDIVMKK